LRLQQLLTPPQQEPSSAAPKTATFPYLIWVLHGGGNMGDVTFCPDVACPG
jgi:hypothetical protein